MESPWCCHDPSTVVCAHYGEPGEKGTALKPDDTSVAYACIKCHDWLDGRFTPPRNEYPWADKEWYWFRAMRRTWRMLIANGVLR